MESAALYLRLEFLDIKSAFFGFLVVYVFLGLRPWGVHRCWGFLESLESRGLEDLEVSSLGYSLRSAFNMGRHCSYYNS